MTEKPRPPHPATVVPDRARAFRFDARESLPPHRATQTLQRREAPRAVQRATKSDESARQDEIADVTGLPSILSSLVSEYEGPKITKKVAVHVPQNEIVVTTDDVVPVLGTVGLCPCIGLAMWGTHTLAFAHLDGSPMKRALLTALSILREREDEIYAQLFASSSSLRGHAERVAAILPKRWVTLLEPIVHDTARDKSGGTLNVAFDLRTLSPVLDVQYSQLTSTRRTFVNLEEAHENVRRAIARSNYKSLQAFWLRTDGDRWLGSATDLSQMGDPNATASASEARNDADEELPTREKSYRTVTLESKGL